MKQKHYNKGRSKLQKKAAVKEFEEKLAPGNFLNKITKSPYPYIFIIALSLIVYLRTVDFGYTGLDDILIIKQNSAVFEDISKIGIAFKTDAFLRKVSSSYYRPLQTVTYFIDAQMGVDNPWFFHVTNLILHILTCLVFYKLCKKLSFSDLLSLAAVLVFCCHPLFVHAVAWIPSRGDLMLTLFGMLVLLTFLYYIETKQLKYLILHTLFFLLAMFSKETAMAFPALLVFYYILFQYR